MDAVLGASHAHAGEKRNWTGPDLERPLSETGHREAQPGEQPVRDYDVTRILSSPAVRCLQTVEPVAARRGLTLETTEVLGVGGEPTGLLELLLDPGAERLLVCSHGELIGTVLRRLIEWELQADSWPKGSTWVLDVVDGQLQDSRYLRTLRLHDISAEYY